MRFLKKMGAIPMALLCLVTACNSPDEMMQTIAKDQQGIQQLIGSVTQRTQVINGILSIESGKVFDLFVDQLDEADNKWNDEFLLEVTGLTIQDLNGMSLEALDDLAEHMETEEDIRGINGDLVYANFEAELGFNSLRALLVHQESEFLEAANPDWDHNPDDHYITGTAERTLLSADGAIMVAGMLYKFMPNGIIYEIRDGDFNTLWEIGPEHAEIIFEADNVEVYNTSVLNERKACRTWVRKQLRKTYNNGKYKYKRITGHGSMIFSNRVYSTVKHYKKKNGKWKKRRGLLKTNNWGSHGIGDPGSLNASCKPQVIYDAGERRKFRRRLTSRHRTFGLGFGKIESEAVKAFHEANGDREYYTLVF